jgi:heme-degrading monooxygenase HmoA
MAGGQSRLTAVTAGFTTVWEFVARAARQAEFERQYGPDGGWVALFRRADGYIGSQLLQDRSNALRYLTIDRWASIEAFRSFRERFAEPYAALDRRCDGLTIRESPLGEFSEWPGSSGA